MCEEWRDIQMNRRVMGMSERLEVMKQKAMHQLTIILQNRGSV